MSKKVHIGNGGTPFCARGLSLNRSTRAKPAITKPREEFLKLPREIQCERCLKTDKVNHDTTDFSSGMSQFLGMPF